MQFISAVFHGNVAVLEMLNLSTFNLKTVLQFYEKVYVSKLKTYSIKNVYNIIHIILQYYTIILYYIYYTLL